jgi:hypothetical protein
MPRKAPQDFYPGWDRSQLKKKREEHEAEIKLWEGWLEENPGKGRTKREKQDREAARRNIQWHQDHIKQINESDSAKWYEVYKAVTGFGKEWGVEGFGGLSGPGNRRNKWPARVAPDLSLRNVVRWDQDGRRIDIRDVVPTPFGPERAEEILAQKGPWPDFPEYAATDGEIAYILAVWEQLPGTSNFSSAFNYILKGLVDPRGGLGKGFEDIEGLGITKSGEPLFELGRVVGTLAAKAHFENAGEGPSAYIFRHHTGDWGELDEDDALANDQALEHGDRILSAYTVAGERIYIITEGDRSVTTVMLAGEY